MREPVHWHRQDLEARMVRAVLTPASWVFASVTDWKRTHASPYRARAKVVCLGNLTSGGTGKTPIAIAIATMLRARNLRPTMLTRGYGGRLRGPTVVDLMGHTAADIGDEAKLLATAGRTIVARNRRLGATLADEMGTDVIVMDDGYQNFSLQKDVALLVVDAQTGFGNGRVLPVGPLREHVANGLARADAVVLVGDGAPDLRGYSRPIFRVKMMPRGVQEVAGRPLIAFAGIGRPEKFFAMLKSLGAELIATNPFPDHHEYRPKEIAALRTKAKREDATLITTEKDFVRLAPQEREGIRVLPIVAQFEAPQAFEQFLDARLQLAPA